MGASTLERIDLAPQTVREIKEVNPASGTSILLRSPDHQEIELPPGVQRMILDALVSIAEHGEVVIGRVPDELTSTVAADMLGVSRPTLLKWSREGLIDSFKVGSHTRFRREDIIRFRTERERERRQAFNELRALDAADDTALLNE
ncbi:helix-turn-helix domain-containing protein [Actinomyces bowdenii]|uniref:DNA-binding protein n=1 Tax=Actinomyces bowdenii TaxID=131109 RepID=A0A3P1V7I2_9ACTO|nr:helix-turn-helix domain-containing protein [Actinomyces bowdenii]MBF0697566.1 helix-turn-helix domain-containing protein [Actinomyces bowdenii]MCR2053299.1 helix-turn-helix domain-containing protein [Actinomyces bowdenii]NYS69739.1 helix-turn-helix domain-containing protein [Actinomyces bowdenii]RRD29305.1 DNA-binding protein [Actinomyces bowdenii]